MFGELLGEYLKALGIIAAAVVVLLIAIAVGIGYWLAQPKAESFDSWWAKHQQTCKQCGAGPDQAMCEKAFRKLQEELRNH